MFSEDHPPLIQTISFFRKTSQKLKKRLIHTHVSKSYNVISYFPSACKVKHNIIKSCQHPCLFNGNICRCKPRWWDLGVSVCVCVHLCAHGRMCVCVTGNACACGNTDVLMLMFCLRMHEVFVVSLFRYVWMCTHLCVSAYIVWTYVCVWSPISTLLFDTNIMHTEQPLLLLICQHSFEVNPQDYPGGSPLNAFPFLLISISRLKTREVLSCGEIQRNLIR